MSAQSEHRMELAGDALADAARLIAVNGLLAESAFQRGDEEEAFAKFRAISGALEAAREIVALTRMPQPEALGAAGDGRGMP